MSAANTISERQMAGGKEEERKVLDFAAILCSRLCHDLVSPVGAFSNGIELLADEEDPEMRAQVIALLEDSARQTSNRLQFFRLAFGAAGGFGEYVDLREAHKAAESLLAGGKTNLIWQPCADPVRKDAVKLLLNLVLVTGESLIRGGNLTMTLEREGNSLYIAAQAEGERIIFNETLQGVLRGDLGQESVDPRCAPAYLAAMIARQLGSRIEIDAASAQRLVVCINLPNAF